jgi:hypothetical protein
MSMSDELQTWRVVMPDGHVVTPPPASYLDAWAVSMRASLGKPALPALDTLPADVRAFVEREL